MLRLLFKKNGGCIVKGSKILNQIGVVFVTCMLMLLYCQITIAATYYIDYASGNDANNGTSTSKPWKHSPGMSAFTGSYTHSNGDVFVFKGGVTWPATAIPVRITNSGVSGSPDVYMGGQRCGQSGSVSCNGGVAWGAGYSVFDGECTGDCSTGEEYGIYTSSSKSYITIDGIKFIDQGFLGRGIEILRGSGWTVKNCWFETKATYGVEYANGGENASTIYIYNNYFNNNINSIYMLGSDGTYVVDDVRIFNNTIQGMDGTFYTGGIHPDGIQMSGYGEWSWTNVKIYNNQFRGVWQEITNSYIYLQWLNGAQIYNNLFAFENIFDNSDNYLIPIGIYLGPSSQHNNDVKIYGNTFSSGANYNTGKGMQKAVTVSGNQGTVDIKNNIFSLGEWGITLPSPQTGTTVTIDYNLYQKRTGGHLITDYVAATHYDTVGSGSSACISRSWECHGVTAEPKIKAVPTGSYLSGDFSLQSDSPAISIGNAKLGTIYNTDINGETRGDLWDIGAYEYGATNKSTLVVTSVNGTVTSNPSGINCGSTCSADYESGTSVTLTASPNSGYTFAGWLGVGCSGTGTCTVTMNEATFVTANYTIPVYNLTVTKSGTGTGTVTGSDGLINCGSTCSVNYESGKTVTLTAVTGSGSIFSGWSGACTGTGTCTVSMTAAKSVTATFISVYTLTVAKSVAAAGTVTSSDGTINCGSTCAATYYPSTSVMLTVSPNSGYTFTGWSGGGCSGTGTCTVTMNAASSVTAYFATTVYNLSVTKSGTGTGTVTGSDGLISCGSTCSVNYETGKTVTLTAVAGSGSTFSGWSGACTGTGTCTVSMTAAKTVTATFATSVTSVSYKLTVRKSISRAGTITANDGGINCGSTCSANYGSGKSVTLTASANSGYKFYKWAGACTGTGTCTVKMTAAKNATAYYLLSW